MPSAALARLTMPQTRTTAAATGMSFDVTNPPWTLADYIRANLRERELHRVTGNSRYEGLDEPRKAEWDAAGQSHGLALFQAAVRPPFEPAGHPESPQ